MRTERFDFDGSQAGVRLSGRLDLPDGAPRAYGLFAHCFSCDKTAKAAVRISRALAALGVGVLRFDFPGLGESDGHLSGFSENVRDVVAAAAAMGAHGCAPTLLVGHSLGGAAVLAAAGDIDAVKAVATIGAPAHPAHVLNQLGAEQIAEIESKGEARVLIAGRPFTVHLDFIEDTRDQQLTPHLANLRKALLVLHSPVDATVGVENASEIFLAARHPKSFVSLDTADHLLSRNGDADYAAGVIAAWASRYVDAAAAAAPAVAADDVVHVEETGAGKFQVAVRAHGVGFFADEPVDVGGLGSGLSPYELVAAGLGACTAMTLRLYAERKAWPLERARVALRHQKVAGQTPPDRFERRIALDGPLDAEQTAKLFEIADKCPVHRTLEDGAQVVTSALTAPVPPGDADDHFRDMDDACRRADG